ncbi:HAD-IIIC family phosphatase [Cognatiluteimonas telluris]|jgi:FkbH-like protein|uniref:HAD-IIIC family phosphatase n=1 Tax=Cognatiluteimonas telluris TaxID=1104775 RepID=UPI001A9C3959|nr:HAD-IIIC family phosphatase [Lysobacter telluris]
MEQEMAEPVRGRVKCVVWDLDHTLWDGILSEGDEVRPRPGVEATLRTLDERGILLSIASKNDAGPAMAKLAELGLEDYFLYPQVNWGAKSQSIARIAEAFNIGIDALAFIDDQPFERDEVASVHADVLCLDAGEVATLLECPELQPRFITDESRRRRQMYRSDQQRNESEQDFEGPRESFLASLGLVFSIAPADVEDLRRLEELVARTNQLNTTGRIYSHAELDAFRVSPRHELLVASLEDKYGEYGKIGLALVEKSGRDWTIRAFLMSCRVISRGVGSTFLNWIVNRAREAEVHLFADMVPNERNRMMYATYRFAGFQPHAKNGGAEVLKHELAADAAYPEYVRVRSFVPSGESPAGTV